MNELVARLADGDHAIVAERSASSRELREQIDRGFVLLKFPNTRGGTELGSRLDMEQTRLDDADFENGIGVVHLVGNLTLNYDQVQLIADIDLASLKGTGHLILSKEAAFSQNSQTKSDANGTAELTNATVQAVENSDDQRVAQRDPQPANETRVKAKEKSRKLQN